MKTKTMYCAATVALGLLVQNPIKTAVVPTQIEAKREAPFRIVRRPIGQFTLMPEATPYIELILKYSAKYDVDPALVLSVIKNESNFDRFARSSKGAIGLMQVMPDTATWIIGVSHSEQDLENPSINIQAGIAYLAFLQGRVQKFSEPKRNALIFAGYNAGHGRIRHGRIPNIKETQKFVSRCIQTMHRLV